MKTGRTQKPSVFLRFRHEFALQIQLQQILQQHFAKVSVGNTVPCFSCKQLFSNVLRMYYQLAPVHFVGRPYTFSKVFTVFAGILR